VTAAIAPNAFLFGDHIPVKAFNAGHKHAFFGEQGLIVELDLNAGKHRFGPNYAPDDAAKAFWDLVTRNAKK
jgi:hypothetical protein